MAAGYLGQERGMRYQKNTLSCCLSIYTTLCSSQCGKLMESLIRVCEAAIGVNLTIAFSWNLEVECLDVAVNFHTVSQEFSLVCCFIPQILPLEIL